MGVCSALARQEVETTLFVHCNDIPAPCLDGVRLLFGKGIGLWSVWTDVTRVIRQFKPDIIHLHAFWMTANHLAFCIARHYSIPVMLSIRGSLAPWALRQKRLKKQIALRCYLHRDLQRATCLHATSDQEAANIRAQRVSRPIVVIPNGVDLPEQLPSRSPVNSEHKTALFLSRLHPGKGLVDLVQAWAQVRPQGWRMRIVGPDVCGHQAEVQQLAEHLGVAQDFEFVGPRSDIEKWIEYVNADLFVHPSHSENFGISIAEALAAGLPVITTKGTPWSELLGSSGDNFRAPEPPNTQTSRCGWWIDIGSDSLAVALQEAVRLTDAERNRMGANGRKLIAAKYTWEAIGVQMKAAYSSIREDAESVLVSQLM